MIAASLLLLVCCDASAFESYTVETKDTIDWRCGDTLIWRFPHADASTAASASERLNAAVRRKFRLQDIVVKHVDGKWALMVGSTKIISSEKSHARGSGMDPKTIALMWLSRIYDAAGKSFADPLTDRYRLKGEHVLTSKVSWYGGRFIGRKCANGEIFTDTHLSAAAKSLPFGTLVRVTLASGKKSVIVRITDRFREHNGRALDISTAAADILGIKRAGVASVKLEVIGRVDVIGGR